MPLLAALGAAVLLASGCASGTAPADRTLTVFAAASLTESFELLAADFERDHPGTAVVLNLAGSPALAQQLVSGARADVFAAASADAAQVVVDAGLAEAPIVFATNRLALVVPAGNPADVAGLDDLARDDLAVALCDPVVPCGAASERALSVAGVDARPDTLEQDVKAVLTKVVLGEADAGLVYVTDARAAGDEVATIDVPGLADERTSYPVMALADAAEPDLAAAWIALLASAEGRAVLAEAGFDAP
ncbi:molybdate ABC transporter substrate-binding protein [Microbacterium awajiense]|uniref:Molybdate ABC transporter substrate-binding protein n=1 Tax=Microbacterium awajiense TaxID=415214 RepID=A0ABP7ACK1_9MICO